MLSVSVPAPPSIASKALKVVRSSPSALMVSAVMESLPEVPTKLSAPVVSVLIYIL